MANIIASPTRYIQGKGEMGRLCQHAAQIGRKLFVILTESGKKRVEEALSKSAQAQGSSITYEYFNGECSMNEVNRILAVFEKSGCDAVVGIGGGKIHDTAKAVAYYAHCPVVIVPTIASTDAPCSALSVLYTDDGVFEKYLFLPSSPNIVLVDTDVVSKAPARLLVSGMGDALATYFEALACQKSDATNCVGGKTTMAAMQLAKLCFETLMENGLQAKVAVENKVCTKAVEKIIEANTYLSGIGFESGGLAGAHAIHNGLTVMEETHSKYHGEKVAFGTLVQLVLEDADRELIEQVIGFCMEVGLPTTLADLGIEHADEGRLRKVAELACAETDTLHNMPFAVNPQMVYAAIVGADALGRYYHSC